jgi:hypothetical protein
VIGRQEAENAARSAIVLQMHRIIGLVPLMPGDLATRLAS